MDISVINHPAYLFIGNHDAALERATVQLQNVFCTHNKQACLVCIACRKIREQQHESILWLNPEKGYTTEDLKSIFSRIAFALEPNQHFFFILQNADLLSIACANALLKSLEEPPKGYHFILLAERSSLVLPTIKSRCLTEILYSKETIPLASLMSFFTTTNFHDPIAFSKDLEACNPSERESLALIDQLIVYWSNTYKKAIIEADPHKQQQAEWIIAHLKKALSQPPMPGSSKLFWKNLFLQVKKL